MLKVRIDKKSTINFSSILIDKSKSYTVTVAIETTILNWNIISIGRPSSIHQVFKKYIDTSIPNWVMLCSLFTDFQFTELKSFTTYSFTRNDSVLLLMRENLIFYFFQIWLSSSFLCFYFSYLMPGIHSNSLIARKMRANATNIFHHEWKTFVDKFTSLSFDSFSKFEIVEKVHICLLLFLTTPSLAPPPPTHPRASYFHCSLGYFRS